MALSMTKSLSLLFVSIYVSYTWLFLYADIGDVIKNARLGDYVVNNVPSLKHFRYKDIGDQDYNTESLVSLSYSLRLLVRCTLNGF